MNSSTFIIKSDDFGIRPAGKPDTCFYCHKKVGDTHSYGCVMIVRKVTYVISSVEGKAVATWDTTEPASWDRDLMWFTRNEGTWCVNNLIDETLSIINEKIWNKLKNEAHAKPDECTMCDRVYLKPMIVSEDVYLCTGK